MAVTALSGQRWQGRSNAGTAPIVGSVSSNTTIKFSDNGSFTPTGSFTVQYVVVGGGGGGSNVNYGSCRGAGGGGAGAYREASFSAVAGTKYTLTVGAGGTGGVSSASTSAPFGFNGTNGTSSAISGSGLTTITSDGGAQGGGHGTNGYQSNATVRTNGNASGGGTSNGETGGTGGTYGNNGGSASGTAPYFGSGGGGANSAGGDGSSGNAGAGGDGTVPSASYFSSTALSAGGGGFGCSSNGAGGSSGIGGAGSTDTTGDAGDANTGSGGGATSGNYTAGAGGSGVILLSFADSESYSITDDSTGTTDEKTTVTDVPVGSQFEETNTRKFYQRSGLPVSLDDMKCYYRFEQTSGNLENTASDIGSSDAIANSDLVVSNATQGTTGKIDYGVTFASGSEALKASSMSLADLGFLSNADALWTICGWVKATTRAGSEAIICNSDFGSDENGVLIRTADASGHINLICGTNGDDMFQATSGTVAIPDTNWNFLMVQYNNSTGNVKMSVNDGTVETVSKSSGGALTNSDTPSTYLYMGNVPELSNEWIGSLDEFVIFNRILTTAELTKIYNAGSGKLLGSGSWVERGTAI